MKQAISNVFRLTFLCIIVFGVVTGCFLEEKVYFGDFKVKTQADLIRLSGYTKITGDLLIGRFTWSEDDNTLFGSTLENLDGLESLTTIGGDLRIGYELLNEIVNASNPVLTDISGLCNLTTIGGTLFIRYNDSLTNIDGLSNLKTIVGEVNIRYNDSLTNLDGLISLTSVGGSVIIDALPALTSIKGLENLTTIGEDLLIRQTEHLESLDGLNNLNTFNGLESDIRIGLNEALTNIDALGNVPSVYRLRIERNNALTSIGLDHIVHCDFLEIIENPMLTDISGLNGIESDVQQILILDNDSLTDISGLSNLTYIDSDLRITNNPSLLNIGFLDYVTLGDDLFFYCNNNFPESDLIDFRDRLINEGWTGCWDFTCDDIRNPVCTLTNP